MKASLEFFLKIFCKHPMDRFSHFRHGTSISNTAVTRETSEVLARLFHLCTIIIGIHCWGWSLLGSVRLSKEDCVSVI